MSLRQMLRLPIAMLDWGRLLALLLLVGFVALRIWDPPPLEIARLKTFDVYQQIKPRTVESNTVAVVDIDDRSLAEYGQWPWPRTLLARLVERLAEAGPTAIAFDIVFAEPDRLSPRLFARAAPQLDPDVRQRLAGLPDNEVVLADALREARVVVVGRAGYQQTDVSPRPSGNSLPNTAIATLGPDPRPYLFRTEGLIANLPVLEVAAAGRGLFTIPVDRDGIIRRAPAVMLAGDQMMPALSIDSLRVAKNADALLVKADASGLKSVAVGSMEVPTDRNGQIWINFSSFDPRRFVSASDVLSGRLKPGLLRNKIVLVGTSAAGLFDLRSTPLDRVRPGVDIHGELIESIVTSNYLVRSPLADGAEVLLAILVGSLMIALVPLVGALPTLALGSIIAFFVLGGSWYLFNFERLLVDPVYPLMSSLAVFGVLVFSNYLSEERRRTEIRNAFSQYLSPALVAQLVRDPGRLKLGGETREITILFSDVRGFTRVAETFKEDPEGLTSLMNRLLTPLSNAVTSREGTIDKYMGDAIMAFWNAPLEDRKHTMNACQSALAMMDEMKRLNAERAERGADRVVDTLDVGIGISTGRVIVGNMGSDLRFDYTVMGDAVNLASRLEGLTRLYDCDVLIAQSTAATILDDFALIELDRVRVKGKAEAETIYALVGGETLKQDPLFARFEDDFQGMRRHYAAGQWEEAMRELASLNDSASAYRLAGTIRLYRERIKAFLLSGPPLDWDGIYNWSEK